jgi:hypothetical protein
MQCQGYNYVERSIISPFVFTTLCPSKHWYSLYNFYIECYLHAGVIKADGGKGEG